MATMSDNVLPYTLDLPRNQPFGVPKSDCGGLTSLPAHLYNWGNNCDEQEE